MARKYMRREHNVNSTSVQRFCTSELSPAPQSGPAKGFLPSPLGLVVDLVARETFEEEQEFSMLYSH